MNNIIRSALIIVILTFLVPSAAQQQSTNERGDEGTTQDYLILAIIVVGGGILLLLLIFFLKSRKICRCLNCYSLNTHYQHYKRIHNRPAQDVMSEQQFQRRKDQLLSLMNTSKRQRRNFIIKHQQITIASEAIFTVTKRKPFLYKLFVDGEDQCGSYEGRGAIVCKRSGLFMWFFKDYDDRFKGNRNQIFYNLLLQTTEISEGGVVGKYGYAGLKWEGQWSMIGQNRLQTDYQLNLQV